LQAILAIPAALLGNELPIVNLVANILGVNNKELIQEYIDAVGNPNVPKSQLNNMLQNMDAPGVGAVNASEVGQFDQFVQKAQLLPPLGEVLQNILGVHDNQTMSLGMEVLKLLDTVLVLPTDVQLILCDLVLGNTNGQPQITPNGLASLDATCKALNTIRKQVGFNGVSGIVIRVGNNLQGITIAVGNTVDQLTGQLGLGRLGLGTLVGNLGMTTGNLTEILGETVGSLGDSLGLQAVLGTANGTEGGLLGPNSLLGPVLGSTGAVGGLTGGLLGGQNGLLGGLLGGNGPVGGLLGGVGGGLLGR
jgi:hypothetical protein